MSDDLAFVKYLSCVVFISGLSVSLLFWFRGISYCLAANYDQYEIPTMRGCDKKVGNDGTL